MSVRLYLTLECLIEVPGCVSERCMCHCHDDGSAGEGHCGPDGYITTFKADLAGHWPEDGQAAFYEQWMIAQWAEMLTRAGGRPLGIPVVWVDLDAYGITNQCPPDACEFMGRKHGKKPGDAAMWHAEGSAERVSDHDGQQ